MLHLRILAIPYFFYSMGTSTFREGKKVKSTFLISRWWPFPANGSGRFQRIFSPFFFFKLKFGFNEKNIFDIFSVLLTEVTSDQEPVKQSNKDYGGLTRLSRQFCKYLCHTKVWLLFVSVLSHFQPAWKPSLGSFSPFSSIFEEELAVAGSKPSTSGSRSYSANHPHVIPIKRMQSR